VLPHHPPERGDFPGAIYSNEVIIFPSLHKSEVAVTVAETRLAETLYNAKIAEAQLRYAVGVL
jgi:hypothetical protein